MMVLTHLLGSARRYHPKTRTGRYVDTVGLIVFGIGQYRRLATTSINVRLLQEPQDKTRKVLQSTWKV